MDRNRVAAMVAAMVVALVSVGSTTGLQSFSVTQVRQLETGMPAVRAYMDLEDLDGEPVRDLPESSLTATLGQWNTDLVQLTPFSSLGRGVAYVFLVDISKSLSSDLFGQMVGGIETWVQGMGGADRAAIIAFGETSKLLTDFTGNKDQLLTALESLGPTDRETLLHQALTDGLDLSRRLDPGLPGRRALVIFSDGKDEGSAFVADDILDRLRDDPTPIYAIGYSRLRDTDEREQFLRLLQRFATNSGGAFYEAEQTRFAEAYDTIRQAIEDVWVADFTCPKCRPDGSLQRLQVRVELDGQAMSSGGSVRLLPLATAAGTEAGETAETAVAGSERADPVSDDSTSPAGGGDTGSRLWLWLIGAAIVVTGALIWRRRSSTETATRSATEADADLEAPPSRPTAIDPRAEAVIEPRRTPPMPGEKQAFARPPAPVPTPKSNVKAPPVQVRLIVVRGSRRGRQYSFLVTDSAIVGKRSSCDCVLTDETGIDAEQFELIHDADGLFIRNLSEHLPTLISGGPIHGKLRISSDTLLGTGDTVLRIVFF